MRVNDLYTRYYDGYTDIKPQARELPIEEEAPCEIANADENAPKSEVASFLPKLPFNMDADDLILIAVLFLIASESNDDFILPIILGYLIISNT